jgi:hypothetical protein
MRPILLLALLLNRGVVKQGDQPAAVDPKGSVRVES